MAYIILKYGELYVKGILLDYWGKVTKLEITENWIEARRFGKDEYKTDDWKKFVDKNEVLKIIKIECKESEM